MSMVAFQGAVELGLIYALMALGLFVSYRVLNIPDMTVDSSFTLGAAVSALCAAAGHPFLGLLAAVAAGFCAGQITAFLQTKLSIQAILAGILSMTALYSINLRIMGGRANIPLLKSPVIFQYAPGRFGKMALAFCFTLAVCLLLILFFPTHTGLFLRSAGDN